MPKGTKPHHDKKNASAHEAWRKRKSQNVSNLKQLEQKYWRQDALKARISAGTMTEKNIAEAKRLGIL